jgi:hypothetical protein
MVREGHAGSAELQLGLGPLLGLLAAPGAFQCFLMLDKYSSLLNWFRGRRHEDLLTSSAPDKYIFLSIAMAIAGIVTVLKWDQILPDAQDYLNLAPLPLRPRTSFLANAAAIGIGVVVVATAVNGASAVLFPLFVTGASLIATTGYIHFMAVHALCLFLASLFAFCAVFAILGALAATLPRKIFRACSSWLRGFLLAAFIMLFLAAFSGPTPIRRLERTPDSSVRLLPPLWYLSLYQSIQHRASPAMADLAPASGVSLGVAFGLTVLLYGVSYRRRFASVLDGGRSPSGRRTLRFSLAFLNCFAYRASGFQLASYRFAVRTLVRNEAQRFWVAISVTLGWLLACQSALPALSHSPGLAGPVPEASLLAAPLIMAYLLILGLRLALDLPAALSANWIFRSTLNCHEHESLGTVRRVMLAFLTPLVLLPSLVVFSCVRSFPVAALQTVYVLALSLCLIEVLLSGYRKIPFTCPTPGFREDLPLRCFLHLLGFIGFTRIGAELERWTLAEPMRFLLLPAAMAAAYIWNRARLRNAREAGEIEDGLSFESRLSPAVLQLKLLDGE